MTTLALDLRIGGNPTASPGEILRERFGLEAFRPWQAEAIEAVLEGPGRVLVVAPTGGGKSLTYQVPALCLAGTTLVVSPLVALMEDQVRALAARGIAATFLASTLEQEERNARERGLLRGEYKLVYLAPERLASDWLVNQLAKIEIGLLAVDEAHCIAHWGHDFRPDYLRVGDLVARLRPRRVLACTATATPEVRREITERLGFLEGPHAEVLRGFARPNLHLQAHYVEGKKGVQLEVEAALREALGDPRAPKGAAIVYAATRKNTEALAERVGKLGYRTGAYHAGQDSALRSRTATAFAARELDVVVATNAFGMGIDRADIRVVVHAQPPASIEAYYQEVGRAGRDGDEAHGLLLCTGSDISLRRLLAQSSADGSPDPVKAARAWALFRDLLRYLDARSCRHDFVLRYFGDDAELLGGCGHCDICRLADGETAPDLEHTKVIVQKALAAVARAQRRGGLAAIVDMLRGARTEKTMRFGFTELSTFGLLKDESAEWIAALLRALLAAGWIDLTTSEHPVPFLTAGGAKVMKGDSPARVVLPAHLPAAKRGQKVAREPKAPRQAAELGAADAQLFEALRSRRAELARESRVPAYVVAFDRTLEELATGRPKTEAALAKVHGMGPSRIASYGAQLLAVIQERAAS